MIVYIVCDIMKKTNIHFLPNLVTGTKPVMTLIQQLLEEGKSDPEVFQLYLLIIRGIDFLRRHGLQESFKTYFMTQREDGRPYTIMLVKELEQHVPLVEFRINWRGVGAFRAVFFEYEDEGEAVLIFVNAVMKKQTYDQTFEAMVEEVESIFTDFQQDPEKYLLIGDEQHGEIQG